MAIKVTYKGQDIIDAASCNKILTTSGKYLEDNITIIATGGGGGSYILIYSTEGATLTCGAQTYTLTGSETYHAFAVSAGTYVCTASKNGKTATESVTVTTDGVYIASLIITRLPNLYSEVLYLQSDGNQIINSIYSCTNNTTIELILTILGTGSEISILGDNWSANGLFLMDYNHNFRLHWGGKSVDKSSASYNTRYTLHCGKNFISVNGDISSWSGGNISSVAISLFGVTNGTTSSRTRFIGRIEETKIYESDILVRDLIPCYRIADDKPGMYDTVTGDFLVNRGSGEFVVGPDV